MNANKKLIIAINDVALAAEKAAAVAAAALAAAIAAGDAADAIANN